MHYHCEIILPPTDDIETAIESILKPFSENEEDSDHPFWDFYVLGGRFAGNKLIAKYDKEKIDLFYKWLEQEKITVSGFQCGKQEISPSDQIPKVDDKWNEIFPTDKKVRCPIFAHSNDQYGKNNDGMINGDVSALSESLDIECSRVIFASLSTYDDKPKFEADFMLCDSEWNGVNHMDIDWEGTIGDALKRRIEKIKGYVPEYREKKTPQDNWICVTVDYHS